MTTYAPSGFGPTSSLFPHQGVRVTFAQTRSALTPDFVEAADFRDNIDHLIHEMEGGGFALAPASGVVVAPGELAATIDFVVAGNGAVSVADAVTQLHNGLYGFLDLARRTYIRRVELIDDNLWGDPIPPAEEDAETTLTGWIGRLGGIAFVATVVGVGLYFLPEIKTALRVKRRVARG